MARARGGGGKGRMLDLRRQNDAAEARESDEEEVKDDDEEGDEDDDEEGDDEAEGDDVADDAVDGDADADADEDAGDPDDEDAPRPKKKAKAKAKVKAKPKAASKKKRAVKEVRQKAIWVVFDNGGKRVGTFQYPEKAAAEELLAAKIEEKKTTFYLQLVKEPIEE